MRWICPRCGCAVSLALDTCPYCPAAEPSPPPSTAPVPPTGATPGARAAPGAPPLSPAEDSPYLRGVRFGVGFLLVVVTVLLLFSLLLEWLAAHPEWQRWLTPARR